MANDGPRILEHMHTNVPHTVHDVKWVPASAKFAAVGTYPRDTGCLKIFELDGSELALVAECEHPSGLKCGTFGASSLEDRLLATGSFSGQLQVFDLERPEEPVYNMQAHKGVLHAIDGFGGQGCGAPEIATCGRDGAVRVWDSRQPDAPVAAFVPAVGRSCRECWAVAIGNSFNDEERCILAGYDNGDVKMFDLRTNSVRWETNLGNGVCSVQFDRPDIPMNKFVAACLESSLSLFDARTQHASKGFGSHTEKLPQGATLWFVRHMPQNRDVFMVGAGDGSMSLHKYCYPDARVLTNSRGETEGVVGELQQLATTTSSSQPVASFDWHPDRAGLFVSAAFDQCVRVGTVTKAYSL